MSVETLSQDAFIAKYTERQKSPTSDELRDIMKAQKAKYQPVGWVMLQCEDMSSSRMGELTIFPYGPNNSLKEVPTRPVSPRGLASDMSMAVAICLAEGVPD